MRRGEVSNKGVQGQWLPQLLINILPSCIRLVLYIYYLETCWYKLLWTQSHRETSPTVMSTAPKPPCRIQVILSLWRL